MNAKAWRVVHLSAAEAGDWAYQFKALCTDLIFAVGRTRLYHLTPAVDFAIRLLAS